MSQKKSFILSKRVPLLPKFFGYSISSIILSVLFFFLVLPVGVIISKAFIGENGFTLDYFRLLFSNKLQTQAITNSLYIGIYTTILATALSLPFAIINTRLNYFGKTVLSGLLLIPLVMPPFVGAIGLQRFFSRFGSINLFLLEHNFIKTPIDWLGAQNQFWAVIILEALHLYPILYLNLSAAIANLDPSLEEAAKTLGSNSLKRFKDILIPLIIPGFFSGAIIVFIWSMTDLGVPLLVGYQESMPVYIFNMVTNTQANPMGYALVFIVIALTSTIFLLSKYTFANKKYEMMGRGHSTKLTKKVHPLHLTWIYLLFIMVITCALIPHLTVAITSFSDHWFMTTLPESYTFNHYQTMLQQGIASTGIKNSLFFSFLSTLIDIILGLSIAYIVTKKLIPLSHWLDALVMIPLALPGIVLAFGYVITYTGTFLDPLNNPMPLLIIAYAIRRLPYMVRAAIAGLQQIHPALEEASLVFGASRFYTLRKIMFPLVTANLIAGALLCFSYAMLDVSDSLILAMKDQFYPLTKAIYALYLEQGNGELLACSLGMVAMAILSFCILTSSKILGKKMGELFKG